MGGDAQVRALLVGAALDYLPPIVRECVLANSEFRRRHGIQAQCILSFGDSGISMRRSVLTGALRKVLSGVWERKVIDVDGRRWRLRCRKDGDGLPKLVLLRGRKQETLSLGLLSLSPDTAVRLRMLETAAAAVNLPRDVAEAWRLKLHERALEDEEVTAFIDDVSHTPVDAAMSIGREALTGTLQVSTLVPGSRRYFDMLVGPFDGSLDARAYAAGTARGVFSRLAKWNPWNGLRYSLFLSAHAALTAQIGIERLEPEDFMEVLRFMEARGDTLSQVGVVEIGLRVLDERPEIAPVLVSLVERIRDDNPEAEGSAVGMFSALFHLVDAEFSRRRMFSKEPPYYRKLAASAQAALIQQQLVGSGVDQSTLRDWAWARSGWQFEMQAYSDMRREPRWDYRFGAPSQVKAECVGRIVVAADEWRSAVSGHPQLSAAIRRLPECLQDPERMLFVGPLEGNAVARTGPKSSMSDEIEKQLRAERVTPLSFVSLVNAVLFFQVNAKLLGLAVDAMARTRYRLRDVETRRQLFSVFRGLAVAAAICRNRTLADSVRKAVRRYRNDLQWRLTAGEALEILMIAAASHDDLEGWMDFVGDVFTDIAFEDLQEDEKNVVAVFIQSACEITPQLWTRCGKADAAVTGCRGAIAG